MSWDMFQREVLVELGHVLYAPLRGDAPDAPAAEADAGMLARLARAAGIDVDALQAHADVVALTSNLRGDAAAKRALWPRLRALRRSAP